MTVLVAWVDKNKDCWMAGDRAATAASGYQSRMRFPKFADAGGFLLGQSGSLAGINIVHSGGWPNPGHAPHPYGFVQTDLVPELKRRSDVLAIPMQTNSDMSGSTWLICVRGEIYEVAQNGVLSSDQDYCAIGQGCALVEGSLATSAFTKWSWHKRIWVALQIAEKSYDGIKGPFDIMRLGDEHPHVLQPPRD